MLKGARYTAELGARRGTGAWPAGWRFPAAAYHRAEVVWLVARDGWRPRGFVLAASCIALGALGGLIVGGSMTSRAAHQKGACAALHMAAAYGYLDERQQRVVMRSVATALNPDVDSFPGGYRAMREACDAIGERS